MGRWGDEVFQNDTALDTLHDCVGWLTGRIQESLTENEGDPDQPVLAAVCCLRALLVGIPQARRILNRENVERWQHEYAAFIEETADDEEQADIDRGIADREFGALLQLIEGDDAT